MTSRKPAGRVPKGDRHKPANWGQPARLNRDIQAKIGKHLRELHDDIVQEGIPDRFSALLASLDGARESGDK
jgi:hypothetical protein